MSLRILSVAICFLFVFTAEGQKVKYKDVFELIEKEQYEQSDKQLQLFMSNPKNADHPNANYQMGKMYMRLLVELHLFEQWDKIQEYTDSTLHYLLLSKELIDEREVKKNDEFYTEFEQRDLRSGEMNVKVFDIHFEIDDKIKWINERAQLVKTVNSQAKKLQSDYEDLQERFSDFLKEKHSTPELYLQAGLGTLSQLESLGEEYAHLLDEANQYVQSVKSIPASDLIIALVENEVEDPFEVKISSVEFTLEVVKLWNFQKWVEDTRTHIVSEVLPVKNEIAQYDKELSDILNKLKGGQIVESKEINDQRILQLKDKLAPFDKDPLPVHMFGLKMDEIKYHSLVLRQPDPFKVENLERKMEFLIQRNELLTSISDRIKVISNLNIDLQIRNYASYIDTRYKGFTGLEAYLKELRSFVEFRNKENERELNSLSERNKYMLAKGETRIPVDSTAQFPNNIFEPLEIRPTYSSGLFQIGSIISAYWVEINSSRTTDEFYTISLESFSGGKPEKVLSGADPSGRYFYLLFYSSEGGAKNNDQIDSLTNNGSGNVIPAYIVKIERERGVLWNKEYAMPQVPTSLQLTQANGLLVNFNSDKDYIEVLENGELTGN